MVVKKKEDMEMEEVEMKLQMLFVGGGGRAEGEKGWAQVVMVAAFRDGHDQIVRSVFCISWVLVKDKTTQNCCPLCRNSSEK